MKIILAPDSFKGNLTAAQVASAFEVGVRRALPNAECIKIPMADGGEGTVQSMVDAVGGRLVRKQVMGAAGKPVMAHYGILSGGRTAVIEIASAAGLPQVQGTKEKNPMKTTSYGVGQLILGAIDNGVNKIIVGLGGSATIDGGAGMAQALGAKFLNKRGREIAILGAGGMLGQIDSIDVSGVDPRIKSIQLIAACDVENPLLGEQGSVRIFGPQKGATPAMIKKLEVYLQHFSELISRKLHQDVTNLKGAGAAGGLGAGLVAFAGAKLKHGIDIIIEVTNLEKHLDDADLVLTGEGRIDAQTAFGKAPSGVAKVAQGKKVRTIAIGGSIADDAHRVFDHGISGLASACARDMSLDEAINHSRVHLANAAERVVRLVLIGKEMTD